MIDVNVTVRFIGRASSRINAGELLSIVDVNRGTPCVAPSMQGVCFASNDADVNREVMCLGFGCSEYSTAPAIQRPLTSNYSDEVNDILPLINVSDVNAPISTSTYTFTGSVATDQSLAFTESPLILDAGVWAVLYLINNNNDELSADIYIDGVFASHTPEVSAQSKFLKATAALIQSTGTSEIALVSRTEATYQEAKCIIHRLA